MQWFLMKLLVRSAVMGAASLVFLLMQSLLRARYSATMRRLTWILLLVLFLLPLEWHAASPVLQLETGFAAAPAQAAAPGDWGWRIAFCIWLAGFLGCLTRHVLRHASFAARCARLSVPADKSTKRLTQALAAQVHVKTPFQLRMLPHCETPMLVGVFQPVIYLPQGIETMETGVLLMRHELTHLRRRDTLFQLLALVVQSIYWFHPLVYQVKRELEKSCELACDEAVLRRETAQTKRQYCETLLQFAQKDTAESAIATGFGDSKATLQERFKNIFSADHKRRFAVLTLLVVLGAVFCSGMVRVETRGQEAKFGEETTNALLAASTVRAAPRAWETTTAAQEGVWTEMSRPDAEPTMGSTLDAAVSSETATFVYDRPTTQAPQTQTTVVETITSPLEE